MQEVTIQKLRRYAAHGIHELAKQDPLLASIDALVQRYIADPNSTVALIGDQEARKLTKWLPENHIGRPFDDQTLQRSHDIGWKVLEVAKNPDSNNANLVKVAGYLHPFLSQDDRTVDMGFDLEEYMDWYFFETTPEEREKYAQELMRNWYFQPGSDWVDENRV